MTVAANLVSRGTRILIGKNAREVVAVYNDGRMVRITYQDARGHLKDKRVGVNQLIKIA